jgi:hypothetical protein
VKTTITNWYNAECFQDGIPQKSILRPINCGSTMKFPKTDCLPWTIYNSLFNTFRCDLQLKNAKRIIFVLKWISTTEYYSEKKNNIAPSYIDEYIRNVVVLITPLSNWFDWWVFYDHLYHICDSVLHETFLSIFVLSWNQILSSIL